MAGFYASTEKANLVVSTTACKFMGAVIYASAACTITLKDSAAPLLGPLKMSALEFLTIMPPEGIACTAGLNATNSGGGYYTIFYGN